MTKDEVIQLRDTVQLFIRSFGLLEQQTTPCGYSLSLSQVIALQELEKQTLTITELAEKLQLDRSSVSRLIDGLVKGGFVSRELNANNRREVIVGLTSKGVNSIENVREQSVQFYNKILGNMSEADQLMFCQGLTRFTESVIQVRRDTGGTSTRTE